jgi:glycerophosphoryl diester phosphodiesterase
VRYEPILDAFRGSAGIIRIVGHRGARGLFPENSMVGFESILKMGVTLIELDVVFSKDKTPIITHNHTINPFISRDVDGEFVSESIKVSSLTVEQIKNYEIGRLDLDSDYGKRFTQQAQLDGIYMPTLQELFEKMQEPDFGQMRLMVEIKSEPNYSRQARENIASLVTKQIRDSNLANKVLLHSFDWLLLSECKKKDPEIITSFLTKKGYQDRIENHHPLQVFMQDAANHSNAVPEKINALGGSVWCPYFKDITQDRLLSARENNLIVIVWTLNERDDIEAMIDLGVDAIVTDYPPRVMSALIAREKHWQN